MYSYVDPEQDDEGGTCTLDLSWLGSLHHLRKLDLQRLDKGHLRANLSNRHMLLHLGGGDGDGHGGAGSRGSSQSLPPRLEELLLPIGIELDVPSIHALAGLRHLTRLTAALNHRPDGRLAGLPPPPLATTLRHIQLELWDSVARGSSLPMVAGLLAAKPPAALRLTVKTGEGTTAEHLLALREVAERVREVASLNFNSCGVDQLQVCQGQGVGCGPCRYC